MKRYLLFFILFFINLLTPVTALACDVCEENQPKVLKGITHGTGPQGSTDYIIIWGAVIIVGVTLFLSIKYLINPKESSPDHVKHIIKH